MVEPGVLGPATDLRPLHRQVRTALLDLLRELPTPDWDLPTAADPWTVHDVVAHLLGDDVGRLSRSRDGHRGSVPGPGESLPTFLNRINDDWVRATARCSPRVLISLLETTSAQILALWEQADLGAMGEAVSWAGPGPAPVWLDCARELTEDWTHQQQVREAVGRAGMDSPEVVHAVLNTFLQAMPYTLTRHAPGRAEGTFRLTVPGDAGGSWAWRNGGGGWRWAESLDRPTSDVQVDADTLWRLCVRMIEPAVARSRVRVEGDQELADAALQIVSIIR
jgi:uncharacterized protein (TIGR03083 family)